MNLGMAHRLVFGNIFGMTGQVSIGFRVGRYLPSTFTTMLTRVSYLLVQELSPPFLVQPLNRYKIYDVETSGDIHGSYEICFLLNDAAQALSTLMDLDSPRRVTVKAYKAFDFRFTNLPQLTIIQLVNPVADFRGRLLGDIKRAIGEIDVDFFENKAIKCPANDYLSTLELDDTRGKIIILFGASYPCLTNLCSNLDSSTTNAATTRARSES